jgi:hypothetical protein
MGPYYAGSHLLDLVIERLGVNGNCSAAPPSPAQGSTTGVSGAGRLLWTLRYLLPYKLRLELRSRLPKPVVTLRRWASRSDSNPWCRKRAFAVPSNNMTGAIKINLKGREPEGLVEPGVEYEALRQEIIDALLALENPETGRSAVQWVARVEDLYQGTRLRDMPDLLVEWDHSARSTRSALPGSAA